MAPIKKHITKDQIKRHEAEMSKRYGVEVKYDVSKGIVVPKSRNPNPKPKKKKEKRPSYYCEPGVKIDNPFKDIPVDRKAVYAKYNGKCAYCGSDISFEEMQVDHIIPKSKIGVDNRIQNLHPSCWSCNHFKRDKSMEAFKKSMLGLHLAVSKYYLFKVAARHGIVSLKPFDGKFYFEK